MQVNSPLTGQKTAIDKINNSHYNQLIILLIIHNVMNGIIRPKPSLCLGLF